MIQKRATRQGDTAHIDQLTPAAAVIHWGAEQIALGFPEEVVKLWRRAGKQITAWLIPDSRCAGGIVRWALEFPLYHALFLQGAPAAGRRLPVLVHRRDWPAVVEYLRLSLLGLTEAEMLAAGVTPDTAAQLAAESAHLALKDPRGEVVPIESLLEPHFFDDEGAIEYRGLRLYSLGDDTYRLDVAGELSREIRLDTAMAPAPPWSQPLPPATSPALPQPLEVIALGASHGFDVNGPCSCLAVQTGGRYLLVDCGPYLRTMLASAGISIGQIQAVVLTHAHEDHAVGLTALFAADRRPMLITTRETAAIMRRKLALLHPHLPHPERLLEESFDLCCLEVGEPLELVGLRLRLHYTMHAIPCVGVELARGEGHDERRILVVGDNNSRANIERAAAEGVLDHRRLEELLALYSWQGDLLVADAGAGAIHGRPDDFRDNPSAVVVLVHTAALNEEERLYHTLARPGHRYTLIPERRQPTPLERDLARPALARTFGVSEPDWHEALLAAAIPLSANPGQVLVRLGDRTADCYLVLAGELQVLVAGEGQRAVAIATIHPGEVFGEMAAIRATARSASVIASTPSRLLRLPAAVWRHLATAVNLPRSLPDLWSKRTDLERAHPLTTASVTTKNALARLARRRRVLTGEPLFLPGAAATDVCLLVHGRAQLRQHDAPPLPLGQGDILDGGGSLALPVTNGAAVALEPCEILAFPATEFARIVRGSPLLRRSLTRGQSTGRAA